MNTTLNITEDPNGESFPMVYCAGIDSTTLAEICQCYGSLANISANWQGILTERNNIRRLEMMIDPTDAVDSGARFTLSGNGDALEIMPESGRLCIVLKSNYQQVNFYGHSVAQASKIASVVTDADVKAAFFALASISMQIGDAVEDWAKDAHHEAIANAPEHIRVRTAEMIGTIAHLIPRR